MQKEYLKHVPKKRLWYIGGKIIQAIFKTPQTRFLSLFSSLRRGKPDGQTE